MNDILVFTATYNEKGNIENLIKSSEPSPQGWADVIKTAIQKIKS